ncbi:hypothetical protein CWI38_0314p0040 [Hamiltosporidium tvaerminnensis]|uniref:Uncharacterized protein n=1 Tax=Hamiltosporidium tvaerminnensis TaxID=1176355 RepID=A0A4Q9M1B8_9MICR|nr:hypothetical protein CWI38_0314p0040 [Hamiltosporidium tvaerminnensis]
MHILLLFIFFTDFISLSYKKRKTQNESKTNTTKKQSITSSHDIGTEENIEIQITNINAETIKNSIKDISEKVFQNFTFYFQIGQIFRKKSNLNENPKVNPFDLRAFSEQLLNGNFCSTKKYEILKY